MCYNSATVISTVTVLIFFNNTDLIEFPLLTVSKKVEEERIKVVIMGSETFIEVILAILIPPLGVFLRYGCGIEFWIDLVLTLLGYLPGMIYAIYVLVA
ncbi:Proteolipid membrane potential modulator [Vigna unguiculata]|uniref:Proteolipid membrane potential modulator n=2 Tax=Vigna unguiculata TaxID=3917 RepID=A0A4D6LSF3_VIGUN|nr:Proteolipid membrane potential modulator [Vigna unguiculata]